jgi:signal transduction histidine kinase
MASAEERLARTLEVQDVLRRVAQEVGGATELAAVVDIVSEATQSLLSVDRATVVLSDEDAEVADMDHAPPSSARHSLTVPLRAGGDVVGSLQIESDATEPFGEESADLLELVAAHVAGPIASARRYAREVDLERMKADFIARVSHELRTPLTVISGFTDTMLVHGDRLDAAQRAEVLQRIKTSVGRLSAMIEEILTVSSFEAGVTRLKLQEVPVRSLLEQARHLSIDESRVRVEGPDDLRVVTDAVLLRHIVNQLVDNALKYAGAAEVSCRRVAHDGVELVVADHGPGIPVPERRRVFQRFYRGNHTGAGMGLGLPVAQELSDQLGAALVLDDTPGGGARFTIRIA